MHRILFSVIAALSTGAVHAAPITITTEDNPPFNMVDEKTQEVTGSNFDKVTELMKRAKESYRITPFPWARAYHAALKETDTCVFSTTRTPEREPLFQWIGPLANSDQAVFARVSDTRAPKSLEDLRPYVIGGYQDDATAKFLQQQGFNVETAISDAQNVPKLVNQRIDYWATGERLGYYLISKSEHKGKIAARFKFKSTQLYLACNSGMNPKRVKHLNDVLAEMERDGTNAAIERKYQ